MKAALTLSFADRDKIIRTVCGEADNQGPVGKAAVAWVLRTRLEWSPPAWWGHNVSTVCVPSQFDCWAVGPDLTRIKDIATTDLGYVEAAQIVDHVFAGTLEDPTGGSTTYKVVGTPAQWDAAVKDVKPIQIEDQVFWRLAPNGVCLPFLTGNDGIGGTDGVAA